MARLPAMRYPRLSGDLRSAIEQAGRAPVIAVDPVLMEKYAIIHADDYFRMVNALVEQGIDVREVFRRQFTAKR